MAQTYTAYVKKYPDLTKAFQKSKGKRFPTAASFGEYHYKTFGSKEGRTIDGEAPSGGGTDAKTSYTTTEKGRIASTDVYAATAGSMKGAYAIPSGGYDWKVTGAFQDLPKRKGYFGSIAAVKRLPMQVGTTKGYARVTNPNEKDRSKWDFIFEPHGLSGKQRFDFGEGVPDLKLGNLFKTKAEPVSSKNVGVRKVIDDPSYASGDTGGGERVSAAISSLDSQYASAIADLQRAALGIPRDAPVWVKTHADYLRWLRIRSSDSGYQSTIVTSPTGVSSRTLTTGVMTPTLLAAG